MSLLREIQTALMQQDCELGPVLLKLRFLASRLGSDLLEEWVKHESEGYPRDVEVPEYRHMDLSYTGSFSGPYNSGIRNAPIPPYLIEKHAGKQWTQYEMRQSVAAIDSLLADAKGTGHLQIDAANLILLMQGHIYDGYACNAISGTLSAASLKELQYTVRTRILELTIQLEKEIPAATEIGIGPAQQKSAAFNAEAVSQLSHQVIYGNVTTIHNTGSSAHIAVNISQGDFDSLIRSLIAGGIEETDAKELAEIISAEEPGTVEEPFGARAKEWLGRNLAKAANGTWKAGISVATSVATEAALNYYGLK